MKEINVESIMEEIRQEIKEKGYTSDMLSFKEVDVPNDHNNNFSIDELRNTIGALEETRYVPGRTDENIGTGIKGLIKRVIRKLVWFNIAPVSDRQNIYNEQISIALSQTLGYIEYQNVKMEEYEERITSLQEKLKKSQE